MHGGAEDLKIIQDGCLSMINKTSITAFWVIENKQYLSEIPDIYKNNILIKGTFKWLFMCSVAKVVFYTHSPKTDIGYMANNPSTFKVQLWYGAPIKMIGTDDQKYTNNPNKFKNKLYKKAYFNFAKEENHDVCFSLSDHDNKVFNRVF